METLMLFADVCRTRKRVREYFNTATLLWIRPTEIYV